MPNSFMTENLMRSAGSGYGGLGGPGVDPGIYDALMANASSNLAAKKYRQQFEENKRQFDTEASMKQKELDALIAERDRRYQLSREAQDVDLLEKGYQRTGTTGSTPAGSLTWGGGSSASGISKIPGYNNLEDIQKLQSLISTYQGLKPYTEQFMDGRMNPLYDAQTAKLYAMLGRQIGSGGY